MAATTGDTGRTRVVHGAALAIASVAAFLLVGELLVRALEHVGVLDLPQAPTAAEGWAAQGYASDPELGWTLLPNHRHARGGLRVPTNSHGLRDRELTVAKPPGTWRVLVLGDSTVFGWGVPFDQTFPEILERRLDAHQDGVRVEVINAGVPAWSIYQCLVYLEREGLSFDPDLIVLETNFNDRRYVPSSDYEDGPAFYARLGREQRWREWLDRSAFYRALRRMLLGPVRLPTAVGDPAPYFEYQRISLDAIHTRVSPERYRALLTELVGIARGLGIPILLVPHRHPSEDVSDYRRARALADAGRHDEALQVLEGVFRRRPVYRIITARRINELAEASGRPEHRRSSIGVSVAWMGTDGNLPARLSDSYVRIMQDAAEAEGVVALDLPRERFGARDLYLDYIHPNTRGHAQLADAIFGALRTHPELGLPTPLGDDPDAILAPTRPSS